MKSGRFSPRWLLLIFVVLCLYTSAPAIAQVSTGRLDAKWQAIGAPAPIEPQAELPGPGDGLDFGPPFRFDTEPTFDLKVETDPATLSSVRKVKPVDHPNLYNVFMSQWIYRESPPGGSHELMAGSIFSVIYNLGSERGVTHASTERREPGEAKDAIASYEIGGHLRGHSRADKFNGMGGTAFAMANLMHGGVADDWRDQPWFVQALIGQLAQAYIGPPLAAIGPDGLYRDARVRDYGRVPEGASIRFLKGISSYAFVDVGELADHDAYIGSALAEMNLVDVFDPRTEFNSGTVRGAIYSLNLGPYLPAQPAAESSDIGGDRSVGRWIGAHVAAPQFRPEVVAVASMQGVVLLGSDRATRQSPVDLDDVYFRIEKNPLAGIPPHPVTDPASNAAVYASLHSVGDVVLGDGMAPIGSTGYSTDAVHVDGVLQLRATPGNELPDLGGLPLHRQVGALVCVRREKPELYLSIAAPNPDPEQPQYRWVRIDTRRIADVAPSLALSESDGRIELEIAGFGPFRPVVSWREFVPPPAVGSSFQAMEITASPEDSSRYTARPDDLPRGKPIEFLAEDPLTGRRARTTMRLAPCMAEKSR